MRFTILAIGLLGLSTACAAELPLGSRPLEAGLEQRSDILFFESYDDEAWKRRWSWRREPENLSILPEGRIGSALRVLIPEDRHWGGVLAFNFEERGLPEPEHLYYRFYLRFGAGFDAGRGGKLAGPQGTYERAGWGGRPSHGDDGWSARIGYSSAGKRRTRLNFYTYHADMVGPYGDSFHWKKAGTLDHDRWYCIEGFVELNDPDKKNGILRAWVDGRPAFEKTKLRFRTVDSLRIEQFRAPGLYYGGRWKAPHDLHVDFDNLVLASERIGCVADGDSDDD